MKPVPLLAICFLLFAGRIRAEDRPSKPVKPVTPIGLDDPLPYGQRPIDYFSKDTQNPAERLKTRLETGQTQLAGGSAVDYLKSLLKALDISPASQMLVYSKTALNPQLVSPETPRAVYFNEDSYVGWVPGAAALEIAAVDPQKGLMFYTLNVPEFSGKEKEQPLPKRESQCLACHAGQSALRVPGGLVRSFLTDETGRPLSGYSRVTHQMPFANRFGGWYVTGRHGRLTHRGNIIEPKAGTAPNLTPSPNNVNDLKGAFDVSRYPAAHSDLVAQMVFQHQIHGQNLLIRVGYEARFGKRSAAEDQLIRYLLFADEAPLADPIKGSTDFAKWFANRGRKDPLGRSLRDWDLKTRLFQHRLSYLIETPLFDGLPVPAKQRIYQKLYALLTAEKPPKPFDKIPAEERRAIWEIVREIKTDLPAAWGAK